MAIAGAPPAAADNRTAALWSASVQLLRNLGAWDEIAAVAEPLTAIRIVDDMGALLRAPEVLLTAAEVGLDALGYNVPNAALVAALRRRAASCATITLIDTPGDRHRDRRRAGRRPARRRHEHRSQPRRRRRRAQLAVPRRGRHRGARLEL